MRVNRLRWFNHVQRRASNEPSELIQVEGTKKCEGKPKITLVEVVNKIKNKDMSIREATENMIQMK